MEIIFKSFPHPTNDKVEAIKKLRHLSGLDLKGAKNIIETLQNGSAQDVPIVTANSLSREDINTILGWFSSHGGEYVIDKDLGEELHKSLVLAVSQRNYAVAAEIADTIRKHIVNHPY